MDAAIKTVEFYRKLAALESGFNKVKILSERKPLYEQIDILSSSAFELLAEEILHRNIKEILKREKNKKIDTTYSDADILNFALTSLNSKEETFVSLMFTFTTSKWLKSNFHCIVADENYFSNHLNCLGFIKAAIGVFDATYATIKLVRDADFTKALAKYKHNSKFGLYTYFSNRIDYNLPIKVGSTSIEILPNGKLFLLNPYSNLVESKQEIIDIMKIFEMNDSRILNE